jgi:hypothetical protein
MKTMVGITAIGIISMFTCITYLNHIFREIFQNYINYNSLLYAEVYERTLYQNGVYYTGIKIFNKLPPELKELVQMPKIFKRSLRRYLVSHCFYTLEEFYSLNS